MRISKSRKTRKFFIESQDRNTLRPCLCLMDDDVFLVTHKRNAQLGNPGDLRGVFCGEGGGFLVSLGVHIGCYIRGDGATTQGQTGRAARSPANLVDIQSLRLRPLSIPQVLKSESLLKIASKFKWLHWNISYYPHTTSWRLHKHRRQCNHQRRHSIS